MEVREMSNNSDGESRGLYTITLLQFAVYYKNPQYENLNKFVYFLIIFYSFLWSWFNFKLKF